MNNEITINIENLEMRYGSLLIQKDLNFQVKKGEIFVIMGEKPCKRKYYI